MRLRKLTDILSPPDVSVVVEDSKTRERVLVEKLENLSDFRYEDILRHEIEDFYIVKRTLYVRMKNPPPVRQPPKADRKLPPVRQPPKAERKLPPVPPSPPPLDRFLAERGISPDLIKIRDGVLYAYAFKEVEAEIRNWMRDKYRKPNLPLSVVLDPETGLPMIQMIFYE